MRFSIITVCLNNVNTIRRTILSVLEQDYKDWEYIIIDGGSTDGTLNVITEFVDIIGDKLCWVSEKDYGIYDAMNKGIALAHGELIGIINSDDWYEKNALSTINKYYEDNPGFDVYYGITKLFYENRPVDVFYNNYENLSTCMIPHPSSFVKRSAYSHYGVFDLRYKLASDYELMLRFYLSGASFYRIFDILSNFTLGGASAKNHYLLHKETRMARYRLGVTSCLRYLITEFRLFIKNVFARLGEKFKFLVL